MRIACERNALRTASLALFGTVLVSVTGLGAASAAETASTIDWSKATTVDVVAVEYDFRPSHLRFRHGVPYRLHLENRGAEMHELTAPKFFHSAKIKNPGVLARNGTDLVVQPHQSADVLFVPERAGHYRFFCADHDWAGMTGDITVD